MSEPNTMWRAGPPAGQPGHNPQHAHHPGRPEGRPLRRLHSVGGPTDPQPTWRLRHEHRLEMVLRVRGAAAKFTAHAWEQRRRDPLAPNAVLIFYIDPMGTRERSLITGSRLFLDIPEAADTARTLFGLARVAQDGYTNGYRGTAATEPVRFDALEHLTTNRPARPAGSIFAGVAAITLDTDDGTWADIQRRVTGPLAVPCRTYLQLVDGSRMRITRTSAAEWSGQLIVESTVNDPNQTSSLSTSSSATAWRWNPRLADVNPDTPEAMIWRGAEELARIIRDGGQQ